MGEKAEKIEVIEAELEEGAGRGKETEMNEREESEDVQAATRAEGQGGGGMQRQRTRPLASRDERLRDGTPVDVRYLSKSYPAHVIRYHEDTGKYDVEWYEEKEGMSTVSWKLIRVPDDGSSAKLCGFNGCTLPDGHGGLCIPSVENTIRPRPQRELYEPANFLASRDGAGPSRVDGSHCRRCSGSREQGVGRVENRVAENHSAYEEPESVATAAAAALAALSHRSVGRRLLVISPSPSPSPNIVA